MSASFLLSNPGEVPLSRLVEDFELYSRNFLRIAPKTGGLQPFIWNHPQRMLAKAVQWQIDRALPIRVVILKSRQVGISTWIQGFLFHRTHLRENRNAITLAHVADSSSKLFEMSRRMYDHMATLDPRHPLAVQKRHLTRKQITFAGSGSSSHVTVVGKGAGRGFTAAYLHSSEMAFWETARETMTAIKQAVPKIPDSAVFIESTPNGFGNEFHRQWIRSRTNRSGYIAVFIAWYHDPTCTMRPWFEMNELDDDERVLVEKYGVTLPQLAWRRDTIDNECDGDKDKFLQEYPSDDRTCFLVSGRPVFDEGGLEYQLDALPSPDPWEGAPPPVEIERKDDGGYELIVLTTRRAEPDEAFESRRSWLTLYHPIDTRHPIPRHTYIVGADPSEGDPGSTASPLAVLDKVDLSLAGLWYGRCPPDLLAERAVKMCRFFNEALLIWEANNHGLAFGIRVRELEYYNVWMRQVSADSVSQEVTDKPGYMETERARQDLFNTLRKYVREAAARGYPPLRDPILVNELARAVYEGSKVMAPEPFLIDCLIAFGLTLQAHRGNMEEPLEPSPIEVISPIWEQFSAMYARGQRPTDKDLSAYAVSADELERYDEMVHNMEKARRSRGLGPQT